MFKQRKICFKVVYRNLFASLQKDGVIYTFNYVNAPYDTDRTTIKTLFLVKRVNLLSNQIVESTRW